MKIFGMRIAGAMAAGFLGLATMAQPVRLLAQSQCQRPWACAESGGRAADDGRG